MKRRDKGAAQQETIIKKLLLPLCIAALSAASAAAETAGSPIPDFEATALTGEAVHSDQLIGQPTILVVTPSKGAAEDTRQWANALRERLDPKAIRIRAVLAVDIPFFMSEQDAIGHARQRIPQRYHDQTWLFAKTSLETALDIPTGSNKAFVLVLDATGSIVVRVSGEPTGQRVDAVVAAVRSLK